MMYRIYSDNELIYDPTLPEYSILDGQLTLELNTSGTLKFTLPKSNPSYGRIKLMKSMITLYDDGRLIFRGRAYAPSVDLFEHASIECEGDLAFFNDTIQVPFRLGTSDVRSFLNKLITEHNKQVPAEKQFKLGNVTVSNTTHTGEITRSSIQYLSTWQCIKDKLLEPLGGYLFIRRESSGQYLDYVTDFNIINNQTVIQSINLLDAKKEITSSELATVIVPIGAKLKNEQGEETEHYLTLEKTTGRMDIRDEKAIKEYGVITKVVHHENITTAERLLQAGQKDLAEALGITSILTLTAADLSKAKYSVSPFLLGNYIHVRIPNLDVDKRLLIRSLSIDLLKPESSTLTIGASEKSLTMQQLNTSETIEKVNFNLQQSMKELSNQSVVKAVREANSHMNQSANDIRLEVSEKYYNREKADELLESIRTLITQTSTSIAFNFNRYKEEQQSLNGDIARKFTELNKYIRFVNGDIILGEEASPLTLKIENDRITFMESGVPIAYWQNRKFYAVDGEFLHSLKLGKFAFIPRPTGNLSFTKVVD
ncbi:phage tail protein [Aerococcaceae bacterium NML191219]|nr:phage tail protein [Aerococcaceae bacterium NML191219]